MRALCLILILSLSGCVQTPVTDPMRSTVHRGMKALCESDDIYNVNGVPYKFSESRQCREYFNAR